MALRIIFSIVFLLYLYPRGRSRDLPFVLLGGVATDELCDLRKRALVTDLLAVEVVIEDALPIRHDLIVVVVQLKFILGALNAPSVILHLDAHGVLVLGYADKLCLMNDEE